MPRLYFMSCVLVFLLASVPVHAGDGDAVATFVRHSSLMCENYEATAAQPIVERLRQLIGAERLSVFVDLGYTLCPSEEIEPPVTAIWYPDHGVLAYPAREDAEQAAENLRAILFAIAVNRMGSPSPQAYGAGGQVSQTDTMPPIYTKCPRGSRECFGE